MIMRLPAIPLITHDPFFSVWQNSDLPTGNDTTHWDGVSKALRGTITIDGVIRRFLGCGSRQRMKLVETVVTPLSTCYVQEALGVRLTLKFTSPLLLDDLDIMSTPVSYVDIAVDFIDGKSHSVFLNFSAYPSLCHTGEEQPQMRIDRFQDGTLNYAYMGNIRQAPLSSSGDNLTCGWGYLFLASQDEITDMPDVDTILLRLQKRSSTPFKTTLLIGYDDIASINYFGRLLPAYYARNGKTITQAMAEFHARHDEILRRCDEFDRMLLRDAREKGGEEYALILTAAYRQTIAGHKLVAGPEGELLFISKENDSNGCAATTDVSYPSVPLFLLYRPELVRAMCRPIFKFAKMPIWKYDFAPHDVGRYPILNGQIYAAYLRKKNDYPGITHAPYYLYPASVDAYDHRKQMPVEESANMILMLAAAGYADGDYQLAEENLDMLRTWCQYLLKYGEDPAEQLCTDDFAGHMSRNVNLSAKAFCGIAAFAMILRGCHQEEEAQVYEKKAKEFAESWLKRASVGDYTSLSFDGNGWSVKYNLVWDKLFGLGLLPESFYQKELKSYLPRMNDFGLPLDSRSSCGKTDWILWAASMAEQEDFHAFIDPIARYLRETQSRVPFSDFYDTETGYYEHFIARTVQGGLFMPLLMDKWSKERA